MLENGRKIASFPLCKLEVGDSSEVATEPIYEMEEQIEILVMMEQLPTYQH